METSRMVSKQTVTPASPSSTERPPIQAPMPSDKKQLKSLKNARSGEGVCEGPVGGLGVVADVIRPTEVSLNMMQISHNTMEETLTIVEGSLHTRGESLEKVGYNLNTVRESLDMVGNSRDYVKDICSTVKYSSLFEQSETK